MKVTTGLILAAVALVNVSTGSVGMPVDGIAPTYAATPTGNPPSQTVPAPECTMHMETPPSAVNKDGYVTVDPKKLEKVDPISVTGLGPRRSPNDNFGSFGPPPSAVNKDGYVTVDPEKLEKVDPISVTGLGPRRSPNDNFGSFGPPPSAMNKHGYVTVDPKKLEKVDPISVTGLGPRRSPNDNFGSFGPPPSTANPDNFVTFDPRDLPKYDSKWIEGLGPEVKPGSPGYKNDEADKAWKDFIAQDSSYGADDAPVRCPQECGAETEIETEMICGNNGLTYASECCLHTQQGDQPVEKAHDGSCVMISSGPLET